MTPDALKTRRGFFGALVGIVAGTAAAATPAATPAVTVNVKLDGEVIARSVLRGFITVEEARRRENLEPLERA